MYDVSIVPCKDYTSENMRRALIDALSPFGGLEWVTPGMNIAIKANMVGPKKPEAAACTDPRLISELCGLLTARGASVVVGDSPGGPFTAAYLNHIYSAAGMNIITNTGAKLNHDFEDVEIDFPDAVAAGHFRITKYLYDADAVIDFCKLKTHGLMAYTGACKNFYGAVPGMLKSEYHYKYSNHALFADMLVDLNQYIRPRIAIADAIWTMEGNGPTAGTPRYMGCIIASPSPHALDLLGASLIGLTPDDVPTLAAAHKRGLIPVNASELHVFGDPAPFYIPDFKLVPKQDIKLWGSRDPRIARLLTRLFASRPAEDASCIGCGKCQEVCPAHAITIKNRRPKIDRSKCIRCFCCQEFCPKGAMKVRRTLVSRLITH